MAGRQDDAAICLAFPDQVRGRRGGKQGVLTDDHFDRPRGRGHAQNDLCRTVVEVSPVAAQNQRFALHAADTRPDRLHEVFQIMRLHENGGLLAKAGRPGFLTVNRFGLDTGDRHGGSCKLLFLLCFCVP